MKCKFCGAEVDEKQMFCPNCGLLLDLSFTPYSVKDIKKSVGKAEEKEEEPEFLRQKKEYLKEEEEREKFTEEHDFTLPKEEAKTNADVPALETDVDVSFVETDTDIPAFEEEHTEESIEWEEENIEEEQEDASGEESILSAEEYFTDDEDSLPPEESITEEVPVPEESAGEEEVPDSEESAEEEEVSSSEEDAEEEEVLRSEESATEEEVPCPEGSAIADEVASEEEDSFAGEEQRTETEECSDEQEPAVPEEESLETEESTEENVEESTEERNAEEAAIYSIKDKQEEEEFFGEIPNDPDNFREKATVPPTSIKEFKNAFPNKKLMAATALLAILGFSAVNYLNSPSVRYSSFLKKGEKLIAGKQYKEAVQSLQKDKGSFTVDEQYYLLLSDALSKEGKHDDAVDCLLEGRKVFPKNEELKKKLEALAPKVSSNLSEELYHDPLSISLKSSSSKIVYSLSGGKEDLEQKDYSGEIPVSRNGKYTLMAYAIASDGAKGELYTREFTVDLDKEKYHLSSFVDSAEGKSYIDENGEKVIGWKSIDGSYYYFDDKGIMKTGFLDLDGEKYYLDNDGKMHIGRLDLDGKSYYFDKDGKMLRNTWADKRYFVDENGEMLKDRKNSDGIYFDANGERSFDAATLYKEHPDSILEIVSKERKTEGNAYRFTAKVYYNKKNGRPSGNVAYETEILVSKSAMMHYMDEKLQEITAQDAVSFLPKLYLQEIVQNKSGVITKFGFVLGERHG